MFPIRLRIIDCFLSVEKQKKEESTRKANSLLPVEDN